MILTMNQVQENLQQQQNQTKKAICISIAGI